jgi:hypothetical protein
MKLCAAGDTVGSAITCVSLAIFLLDFAGQVSCHLFEDLDKIIADA